jgi:hypothetical protein
MDGWIHGWINGSLDGSMDGSDQWMAGSGLRSIDLIHPLIHPMNHGSIHPLMIHPSKIDDVSSDNCGTLPDTNVNVTVPPRHFPPWTLCSRMRSTTFAVEVGDRLWNWTRLVSVVFLHWLQLWFSLTASIPGKLVCLQVILPKSTCPKTKSNGKKWYFVALYKCIFKYYRAFGDYVSGVQLDEVVLSGRNCNLHFDIEIKVWENEDTLSVLHILQDQCVVFDDEVLGDYSFLWLPLKLRGEPWQQLLGLKRFVGQGIECC